MIKESEIKALVALLDDSDSEIVAHVESKLLSLGDPVIPLLEDAWEKQGDPAVQQRLEDIIHNLQLSTLVNRLRQWHEKGGVNLLKGMWVITTYLYPTITYQDLKKEVDQLYYEAWLDFRYDMQPFDQVKMLNSIFYGKLKFKPDTKNFHSPSNSMINRVIETRKGNPISLCTVYMMIANKLKLPIYGVNLPNLFILTYKNDYTHFYINVFNKGLVFSKADIDNYIANLNMQPVESYYEPCSHIDIIRRVINNLIVSFTKTGNKQKVEELKKLLEVLR
ncbi:transglutaminase-like domain-containing protein [Rapidithrix thailandica]|uniref:Transglutaminase-like domain-containing protein n=1 Tax=Rapidithrix thailandica TaxID=413964 RepID=A0AAW9S8F1_9BACT